MICSGSDASDERNGVASTERKCVACTVGKGILGGIGTGEAGKKGAGPEHEVLCCTPGTMASGNDEPRNARPHGGHSAIQPKQWPRDESVAHRSASQEKIEWAPSHYDCRPNDFLLTGFACVRGGLFGGHCFSVWGEGKERGEKGGGGMAKHPRVQTVEGTRSDTSTILKKIPKADEGDLTTRTLSGKCHPAAVSRNSLAGSSRTGPAPTWRRTTSPGCPCSAAAMCW